MHVQRLGLAPVKGTRHGDRPTVELTREGPVGDRVFCLVDAERARVLRTVENTALLGSRTGWDGVVLRADVDGRTVEDVPRPTGAWLRADYWGRSADVEVVEGPWAAAWSELLGRDVQLARATRPGAFVYAGSVTLVTSSSLERLAEELGEPVDDAQFRATVTVATDGEPAHVEDGWHGCRLRIGEAEVEVLGNVPRCAVVDLDPATGAHRAPVLATLAGYRRVGNEIPFGVEATVTQPGRVDRGADVERG